MVDVTKVYRPVSAVPEAVPVARTSAPSSDEAVAVAEPSAPLVSVQEAATVVVVILAGLRVVWLVFLELVGVPVAVPEASSEVGEAGNDDVEEVMAPFSAACGCVDGALVVVDCSLVMVAVDAEDVKEAVVAASAELDSTVEKIWCATVVWATGGLVATAEMVGVLVGVASALAAVTAAVSVCAGSVATADFMLVVEVLVTVKVDVVVDVDVRPMARRLPAARTASSISSSETGFSRASQPACTGASRPEPTPDSPSGQTDSMHSSTVSRRPFLDATHMSFWSSSLSVLYPACWMQS